MLQILILLLSLICTVIIHESNVVWMLLLKKQIWCKTQSCVFSNVTQKTSLLVKLDIIWKLEISRYLRKMMCLCELGHLFLLLIFSGCSCKLSQPVDSLVYYCWIKHRASSQMNKITLTFSPCPLPFCCFLVF